MLRLSKMADYGIVLLTYVAQGYGPQGEVSTARGLAEKSGLPLPTVSKVLKSLSRYGLLVAQRGKHGGYTLARAPEEISVVDMIKAVEGPIALTECSTHAPSLCELEGTCPVRSNWSRITSVVQGALQNLTLADMATPNGCGSPSTTSRSTSRNGQLLELVR